MSRCDGSGKIRGCKCCGPGIKCLRGGRTRLYDCDGCSACKPCGYCGGRGRTTELVIDSIIDRCPRCQGTGVEGRKG